MNQRHGARLTAAIAVLGMVSMLAACGGGDRPDDVAVASVEAPQSSAADEVVSEEDRPGLVDYGGGPVPEPTAAAHAPMAAIAEPPWLSNGGPKAGTQGAFGPAYTWPLIPLHMVMLPDGRILAYGSDALGAQNGLLNYAVYDPQAAGYPFLVLPNTTNTDLFCSTLGLLPQDGKVMIAGGDRIVNGVRNYANADVNVFDPATGNLAKQSQPMNFRRWYASGVITSKGDYLLVGGRDDVLVAGVNEETYSTTPEIYSPTTGWRTLPGARSDAAFGNTRRNWWYPKAWLTPTGRVAVLANGTSIYQLDPSGGGTVQVWKPASGKLLNGSADHPAVMFKPGKVLSSRDGTSVQIIDFNGSAPTVQNAAPMSTRRAFGSMTLLPDSQVWANGGSSDGLIQLTSAVYTSELWNPFNGTWTLTASATKPRLYHGNAILLRDGRVLTGGGGAPGPVKGLNAEIYYPPYLFKRDGSGTLAPRPAVTSVSTRSLLWSSPFTMQMSTADPVSRVVILRTGSATHAFNGDQRLIWLTHAQVGNELQLTMPGSRANAPPGYYMIFVIDPKGVPSVGEIVKLG